MLYSSLVSTVKQKMKKELKITSALWKSALYHSVQANPAVESGSPGGIAESTISLIP
jgi:hypothetical protein